MAVTDYSKTAASNTSIGGTNIDEGCSPAGINDALRRIMADLAGMIDGDVTLPNLLVAAMTVGATALDEDDLAYLASLRATGVTSSEFDRLDGLTASTAELNKLDGFTGSATDLNYAASLRATGVTTTEFDRLDGLTATASELNKLDGVGTLYHTGNPPPDSGPTITKHTLSYLDSTQTVNHGLGGVPDGVTVSLRCIAAQHGYSVGDTIPLSALSTDEFSSGSNNVTALYFECNSTQIRCRARENFRVRNAGDTSQVDTLTYGAWVFDVVTIKI